MVTIIALVLLASGCWIYITTYYIKLDCPGTDNIWFITLSIAVIIIIALSVTVMLVVWVIYSYYTTDQAQLEQSQNFNLGGAGLGGPPGAQPQQILYSPPGSLQSSAMPPNMYKTIVQQPDQYVGQQQLAYGPPQPAPSPVMSPHPHMVAGYDHTHHMRSPYYGQPSPMGQSASPVGSPLPLMGSPNPHQQQQQPAAAKKSSGGVRKIGSDDSTGSSYYQQLMKTKGGVKSISQYGELLKQQRKTKTKTKMHDQKQ